MKSILKCIMLQVKVHFLSYIIDAKKALGLPWWHSG